MLLKNPKRKMATKDQNRFFSARVVNPWNVLGEKNVTVGMVDIFKRQLSEF